MSVVQIPAARYKERTPVNILPHRIANQNQTALHFVASKKNMDIARLLLESTPPASTRVRDRRGQYPIHRAAAVGSAPMVTLLLKNKSPLNPTDNEGYTPLHHAVAEGHGTYTPRIRCAQVQEYLTRLR